MNEVCVRFFGLGVASGLSVAVMMWAYYLLRRGAESIGEVTG